MSPIPGYTLYHPRWYRTRVSTYWWLGRLAYLKFILRELSSVFVAFSVVLTLLQLRALRQGPESYAEFQRWLGSPILIAVNAVSLFFVLFHTVTWFNLAPRAMALRVRGKQVRARWVALSNYIAWLALSAGLVWLLTGG